MFVSFDFTAADTAKAYVPFIFVLWWWAVWTVVVLGYAKLVHSDDYISKSVSAAFGLLGSFVDPFGSAFAM